MENLQYFILLIIMLNLFSILLFTKFIINQPKKSKVPSGDIEKRVEPKGFEHDVQYLMFIVDYFCNHARDIKLIPYQKANANDNFINDDTLHSVIFDTTRDIMSQISDEYRRSLGFYMENVTEFVSTLVFNRMTAEAMKLNKEVIKKYNRI